MEERGAANGNPARRHQLQSTRGELVPGGVRALGNLRLEIVLVLALGLLALTPGISKPPLVDWDEATYAQVAHEVVASGHYLDLTWNGQPYLRKPPLLFWEIAASFRTFGESEFAARLPSVLMGLGTLMLIYLCGTATVGRLAGTVAAIVPLQFYFFISRGGRDCATDAPMLFFSTLAIYALVRAREKRRWVAVCGGAIGLAILSKGLAGIIPLIVVSMAVALIPGFEMIGSPGLRVVYAVATVTAAPWYIYQMLGNPDFIAIFVGHETLARLTSHLEDDTRPAGYTIRVFLSEIRHLWPLALPLAALVGGRLRAGGLRDAIARMSATTWLWLLWLAVALGAACAVQTKLPWYILPSLVPVALLAGTLVARALQSQGSVRPFATGFGILALTIVVAHAPDRWRAISHLHHEQRLRSMPSFMMGLAARRTVALKGPGQLYFAGVPLPTLVYYAAMRCDFVSDDQPTPISDVIGDPQPPPVNYHDLVMVNDSGESTVVANLGTEWRVSGPEAPRDQRQLRRLELEAPTGISVGTPPP